MRIGREVGHDQPVFLVAEVGVTSNGDLDTALKLADAVKASGADAIKYMLIDADHLMADRTQEYTFEWAGGTDTVNMYDMFKRLEFPPCAWWRIVRHCEEIELPWFLSADSPEGVAFAEQLGCPAYKVSSWDLRNFPLLEAMARTGKPMLIDLGPAVEGEILTFLEYIQGVNRDTEVMLVHTTHAKDPSEYNLRTIPYLMDRFPLRVGWSAVDDVWEPDQFALCAGACLIEKRITLDVEYHGHHHHLALEPDIFMMWVDEMRDTERILGRYAVVPSLSDLAQKQRWFTSIHAAEDIPEGATITRAMLYARRPGGGESPLYLPQFLGKRAKRAIAKDTYVRFTDV